MIDPLGHLALVLGDQGPETIVVTRHPSLIVFLKSKGMIPEGTKIISHVKASEEIRGKHVVGILPLHWAAVADRVTEVPLDLPAEARGRELSVEEIERFARTPRTYRVTQLGGFGDSSLKQSLMMKARTNLIKATQQLKQGELEKAVQSAGNAMTLATLAEDLGHPKARALADSAKEFSWTIISRLASGEPKGLGSLEPYGEGSRLSGDKSYYKIAKSYIDQAVKLIKESQKFFDPTKVSMARSLTLKAQSIMPKIPIDRPKDAEKGLELAILSEFTLFLANKLDEEQNARLIQAIYRKEPPGTVDKSIDLLIEAESLAQRRDFKSARDKVLSAAVLSKMLLEAGSDPDTRERAQDVFERLIPEAMKAILVAERTGRPFEAPPIPGFSGFGLDPALLSKMTPLSQSRILGKSQQWTPGEPLPDSDPFTKPTMLPPAGHVWAHVYGSWVPEPEAYHREY